MNEILNKYIMIINVGIKQQVNNKIITHIVLIVLNMKN